jgi:hypothetical protein
MKLTRRSFLQSILAAGVAPAVCRSSIIMPVSRIWVPDKQIALGKGVSLPPNLFLPPEDTMAFGQKLIVRNDGFTPCGLHPHGAVKDYVAGIFRAQFTVKPGMMVALSNDFGKWVMAEVPVR